MKRTVLALAVVALVPLAAACNSPADAQTPIAGTSEVVARGTFTATGWTVPVNVTTSPIDVSAFRSLMISVAGETDGAGCNLTAYEADAGGIPVERGSVNGSTNGGVARNSHLEEDGKNRTSYSSTAGEYVALPGPLLLERPGVSLSLASSGGNGSCVYKVVGRR